MPSTPIFSPLGCPGTGVMRSFTFTITGRAAAGWTDCCVPLVKYFSPPSVVSTIVPSPIVAT